jgi:hypothetical protein
VTQEDIDKGQQGAPASCAIAMRLSKIEGLKSPHVNGSHIEFWLHDIWYRCSVHHVIREWIHKFDNHRADVKPVTFTLTLQKHL